MEAKYYKSKESSHSRDYRYRALLEDLEMAFWGDGSNLEYNSLPMWTDYLETNYKEITREEFMKAYLPVNEKINNKIAEL